MYLLMHDVCLLRLLNLRPSVVYHFFFNDTATTEIYTLSLHDALPISAKSLARRIRFLRTKRGWSQERLAEEAGIHRVYLAGDRKSTRLNSSHVSISYAVFCLKKKR